MRLTVTQRKSTRRAARNLTMGMMLAATLALTGCPKKGAAQRAGESIDHAKDSVADTLNPKGPAEKAGRAIDRATE